MSFKGLYLLLEATSLTNWSLIVAMPLIEVSTQIHAYIIWVTTWLTFTNRTNTWAVRILLNNVHPKTHDIIFLELLSTEWTCVIIRASSSYHILSCRLRPHRLKIRTLSKRRHRSRRLSERWNRRLSERWRFILKSRWSCRLLIVLTRILSEGWNGCLTEWRNRWLLNRSLTKRRLLLIHWRTRTLSKWRNRRLTKRRNRSFTKLWNRRLGIGLTWLTFIHWRIIS